MGLVRREAFLLAEGMVVAVLVAMLVMRLAGTRNHFVFFSHFGMFVEQDTDAKYTDLDYFSLSH